jgi:hypothetical protein
VVEELWSSWCRQKTIKESQIVFNGDSIDRSALGCPRFLQVIVVEELWSSWCRRKTIKESQIVFSPDNSGRLVHIGIASPLWGGQRGILTDVFIVLIRAYRYIITTGCQNRSQQSRPRIIQIVADCAGLVGWL